MRVLGRYSFNGGQQAVHKHYPNLLGEIEESLAAVEASQLKTKTSREKTMPGRMLFSPRAINQAVSTQFERIGGWHPVRVPCEYSASHYSAEYQAPPLHRGAFREMDFVKDRLGVEVQFGKYAFMVYNVCAKMTIFHNLNYIDVGVEIVPVKSFADEMSSGVSYFEQFVWDLQQRGVSNIDIPVLILGVGL